MGTFDFLDILVGLAIAGLDDFGVGFRRLVVGSPVSVAEIAVDDAGLRKTLLVDAHDICAVDVFIGKFFGEDRTVEERTLAVLLAVKI